VRAGHLTLLLATMEAKINYYEVVTQIARMVGDPRISFAKVKSEAERFKNIFGVVLDMDKLEQAYKQFKGAKLPRAAYGRS